MKALEQILAYVQENNPALYEHYCMAVYEDEHGAHFNKEYATRAVDEMYHTASDGMKCYGEHWSIDEVKNAIEPYKAKIPIAYNCWDAYVALNMWWHDLGKNYKSRDKDNYESAIIEDALTWAFLDEDAAEGKVWHYMQVTKE